MTPNPHALVASGGFQTSRGEYGGPRRGGGRSSGSGRGIKQSWSRGGSNHHVNRQQQQQHPRSPLKPLTANFGLGGAFDGGTSPLPLPLSSCLGCIPPLIGLPSLRFYAVGSSLFLLSVCFCLCSLFYRDDVLCWLLLARPFLYAFHAHLRFPVDLVWFRLSCDHGWIRSGSVNVRKQQQQNNQRRRVAPKGIAALAQRLGAPL